MGGFIQKTLQRGRGKEERYYRFLIPAFFGVSLSLEIALLFFGLAEKRFYLYWIVLLLLVLVMTIGYIKKVLKGYLMIFLLGQLVVEGLQQVWSQWTLHLMHYPIAVGAALFFKGLPFWSFFLFQPLLHLNELIKPSHEIIFFLSTEMPLCIGTYFFVWKIKKREDEYRQAYKRLVEEADLAVGSQILDREAIARRYLSEKQTLKADLKEVARTISKVMLADRTTIFLFEGGRLKPSVSDEEPLPDMKSSGIVYEVIRSKNSEIILLEDPKEDFRPGFVPLDSVMSLCFCPVKDNQVVVGIIVVESLRYRAFEERDIQLLEALSVQVAQLLKKHRLLSIMGVEHELLHSLQKESERLLQSLELQEVTKAIKDGALSISGAEYVFVLLRDGRSYIVMEGIEQPGRRFSLKGTLLEDIALNKQPFYFRDVKQFKKKPLPFEFNEIRSLAGFPLLSGKDITGMVVITSKKVEAFTERHLSIMHLYCNQASETILRALLHEDMKMKALTDGLTGLYNHRHFQERLEENIKRAERLKEKLSLLLLDIDHFKKINDTYGHPVGDYVLKVLAATINEAVREIDLPARYGGEEFAVLLLGAGKKQALQIAERLREKIKRLKFKSTSGDFSITVSIGIATFPDDAASREALIEKADEALYDAKNMGRDRIILAGQF